MSFIDILSIAFNNLTGNKLRTALTVLGIGVGIATIVFLISFGYGIQELSLKRIASIGAVSTINVSAGKAAPLDAAFVEKYQKDTRVEKVVTVNAVPTQLFYSKKRIDGVVSIVDSDFFSLEGLKPAAGDFFKKDATRSIVVSSGLVTSLGAQQADAIGKDLRILLIVKNPDNTNKIVESTLKIRGIFTDDASVTAYATLDQAAQLGDLAITQAKVKVKDRAQLVAVKNELDALGYSVTSVADTIDQLDLVFKIINIVLGVFGGIALLVASIGMFNTMTIALLERTRDVGVMKATGADDSSIYLLFLVEAILISVLGGLSGLTIGWLTTRIVNYSVNLLAQSVGGEPANLFTTPLNFVLVMLAFAFAVGFSTGFFPARRGAKINPLDALRYE
jgi:putative ABC transport system permease protein